MRKLLHTNILIMKHLPIIFLLFFGIVGCLTKEKALRKLDKDLPKICADRFPVKDSTIYLPGDTINTVEFFENSDTVVIESKDTVTLTVTNTVTKVIRERITDTLRLVRENTARVAALNNEISLIQAKLNKAIETSEAWEDKAENRLKWLLIALFCIAAYIVLKIIRK